MPKRLVRNQENMSLLPPRDVQLRRPEEGSIPTPTDEWGLIDIEQLLSDVKETISPEYEWREDAGSDQHHIYWPHSKYPNRTEKGSGFNPNEFNDLSMHKIWTPRDFHNWLHRITEPPPAPSKELMQDVIEAYRSTKGVFDEACQTLIQQQNKTNLGRLAGIYSMAAKPELLRGFSPEEGEERRIENLSRVQQRLGELAVLPEQFRPVIEVDPNETPHAIARLLGKIVTPQSLEWRQDAPAA